MTVDVPHTTYSNTGSQRRVITDAIDLIDPAEIPVITAMGGLDGASSKLRFMGGKNTKIEWQEDTLAPITGTTNGAQATSVSTLVVTDGSLYKAGDVILVGSEGMHVTSISSNTLTVTRGFIGSAATHATAQTVTFIGMARLEDATSDYRAMTTRSQPYNYTGILQEAAYVSRSQEQMSQYGLQSEMEYQMAKKIPELMRIMERGLHYNTRKSGSTTTPRQWGGFVTFITDNSQDWGTALELSDFTALARAVWADGGSGPLIGTISSANKATANGFLSSALNVARQETVAGQVVDVIDCDVLDIQLLPSRHAKEDRIWCFDPKRTGFVTYSPFTREEIARVSDGYKEEYIGEFSFACASDKAHGYLYT